MRNQPGGAPPVFVDRTGRRRRLTMIAGTVLGLGLLTSVGLIAAGLFWDSAVSLPGWSDPGKGQSPIKAGVGDRLDEAAQPPSRRPLPSAVTSTAAPVTSAAPTATRPSPTATGQPSGTTVTPTPQPTHRGQGVERRNSTRPSKSPGKP
ncbi:hypothetical protein K7640_09020 [Micromonospora sp. PLK6-60]|uniref:hypothetical protein n=1 Tax=Micromonospora sp. PLK6-60 TaxID=2873383 RepID=UPI001CA73DF5|nr:hypothetical protein [Micromonospora sp. PLK6-60]MBY8871982.1 hypothetical protein [Micromonospora sp. PLK6-60]